MNYTKLQQQFEGGDTESSSIVPLCQLISFYMEAITECDRVCLFQLFSSFLY